MPEKVLAPLKAELAQVDHASPPLRQASLRRVIGALEATGLALPPELRQVIAGGTAAQRVPVGPAAVPRAPASIPAGPRPPAGAEVPVWRAKPPAPGPAPRAEGQAVPVWRATPPGAKGRTTPATPNVRSAP